MYIILHIIVNINQFIPSKNIVNTCKIILSSVEYYFYFNGKEI